MSCPQALDGVRRAAADVAATQGRSGAPAELSTLPPAWSKAFYSSYACRQPDLPAGSVWSLHRTLGLQGCWCCCW